jgi:hypothetical protein
MEEMSTVVAIIATVLWGALVVALSAWRDPTRRIAKRLRNSGGKTEERAVSSTSRKMRKA